MHQASKKLKLSSGSSKKSVRNDDFGMWGDDLELDDGVIQQIESQGYSQFPIQNVQKTTNGVPKSAWITTTNPSSPNNEELSKLKLELQTKNGEVKNLRMELEHREKEYAHQIVEKNNQIEELKKQLSGTKIEIEFQKHEMRSQISKAKVTGLNSPRLSMIKQPNNLNSSFHERFSFSSSKPSTSKEEKVFKFMKHLHKGDTLYKLLKCILSEDVERIKHGENLEKNPCQESGLSILKSLLWQLCRYSSFEEFNARFLIKNILNHTNTLLMRLYKELAQESPEKTVRKKTQAFELNRMKDETDPINPEDLLKYNKLFAYETDVSFRQTMSSLAILIEIHPPVGEMIVEKEQTLANKCVCQKNMAMAEKRDENQLDFVEKMETDQSFTNELNKLQNILVFDFVEVMHCVVQEMIIKDKILKYEGVLCSMLHVFSILCSQEKITIYEKQQVLIMSLIQKILFSLPGFHVVRYIIRFLAASSQFLFSDSLCCRSAADTFIESFSCYTFTKDTCMLQILCAYSEMMKRTPCFIDRYTYWILSCVIKPHEVRWINNKTDRQLCECLLMVEQFTIRIMLSCVEMYIDNETSSSCKKILLESLNRCILIFQRFRHKDSDFDLHILPCRGEYVLLLRYLNEIVRDERTKKFVNLEFTFVDYNQKYNLSVETRNEIVKSLLTFPQDYHL